jgi:hypothetical protein
MVNDEAMEETHEDIAQSRETSDADVGIGGEITVYIDRNAFRVPRHAMTGGALRALATPPISSEYELYHVSVGSGPDLLVHDEEVVELEDSSQFFSAPKMIMAGRSSSVA